MSAQSALDIRDDERAPETPSFSCFSCFSWFKNGSTQNQDAAVSPTRAYQADQIASS
jgi:hypothetical protein